jgi:hypothetical protein
VTFHEEDKLRTVLWQWADKELSHDEKVQLVDLRGSLTSQTDEFLGLITDGEFQALLLRIDRLLSTERFPAPSDEWPAVPWPPF